MQTTSLTSLSAVHEVASLIAGVPEAPEGIILKDGIRDSNPLRAGRDFTELVFADENGHRVGSTITIVRPQVPMFGEGVEPASVGWSSSSTQGTLADADVTGRALVFAAAVASKLNDWAREGLLPYLSAEVAS